MGDLNQILKIRSSRLDRLRRAENSARENYNAANDEEIRVKQKISEYKMYVAQMEIDLLENLINSGIDQGGLEEIFQKLETAQSKAVDLKKEHDKALKHAKSLEAVVDDAWRNRVEAQKKFDKMTQLNEIHTDLQKQASRKQEQAALDNTIESMLAYKHVTK